jgi:hypothetical protein
MPAMNSDCAVGKFRSTPAMRSANIVQLWFIVSIGLLRPAMGAEVNDPILGQWKWFTKSTKVFHADGRLTDVQGSTKKGGTWKCENPGELPRKYVIVWEQGKMVDTLILEKEDNHLSGKNKQGVHVSAERLSREDPDKAPEAPVAQTAPPVWSTVSLTEPLAPYIRDLTNLLSLHRTGNKQTQEFLEQASGRLIVVRQEIVVKSEKATNENIPAFNAALRTCDLLSAALADRSKTLGDLQASGAVKNGGKLEEPARKDNLTQGIRGDGFAKAVGSVVERDRERAANAKAAKRAANSDNALTAMAENQWNQRSAQWTSQIAAAYGEIK